MARYEVEFSKKARTKFEKLDAVIKRRIGPAIDSLGEDPHPAASKRLECPEDLYSLRVGAYRVIYTVEDDVLVVLVVQLGHRRDVYRGL